MKKIIVTIVISILCIFVFCGWKSSDEERVGIRKYVTIFTDEKTGVEYVVYDGYYGCGICPRYNADETMMLDKE